MNSKGEKKMSNVISNKKVKNYEQALQYLNGKKERPFAHNTRIEIDSLNLGHEVITIKYHGNSIVNIFPDYVSYSSCGWKTTTTKERLNWFLQDGFALWQEKSVWYISDRNSQTRYIFADGICIDKFGKVSNAGSMSEFEENKLKIKQIKKYVENYISELISGNIPSPSGGDCWLCCMQGMGESDHINTHIEESYFVPSLLTRAVEYKEISSRAKNTIARIWQLNELPSSKWEIEILTRDVKSSLTAYIKHELNIAQ